ncbi:chitin disaccharide deacetylase [Phytobacter sp. SCO41]|uniref:Chitooligosaccharide deacetylase n=1 Tax=Citrobacter bitternis TaxID=1585982 RepID=A0ABW1Q2R8_9ENTR|nr:chitin disaccharide deacetylase [Phytobacter sp. SCO41]
MQRLLIVNADDFGLSRGQNYGIVDACRNGVVTSTTALVNGAAIEHAVALCEQVPELAVGLHFTLTLGKPVGNTPSLTREGKLGKWIWDLAAQGSLPLQEIADELACQYARFIALFGKQPSHIDSHHHVHMIGAIFPLVAAFARQKGIPLRVDRDEARRQGIDANGVCSTSGFSSAFYGDEITVSLFTAILDAAALRGDSSLEIMSHPAFVDNQLMASQYCYPRLKELEVLTQPSLKRVIAERAFRPGTFRDL